MRTTFRQPLICFILLAGLPLTGGGQEAEGPGESVEDPKIERILELRAEIEKMLADLSPQLRQEVERRWQEILAVGAEEARLREAAKAEPAPSSPPGQPEPSAPVAEAPGGRAAPGAAPEATAAPEKFEVPATPEAETGAAPETATKTAEAEKPAGAVRKAEPEPSLRRPVRPKDQGCNTLEAFDGDGDGLLTGADRYWRHFYLFLEGRSGAPVSLFELGIRQVAVRLGSYGTVKGARGGIDIAATVRFELVGKASKKGSRGDLVIDADGLARGGLLSLIDAAGTSLTGHQALRPGLGLESADGARRRLICL